MSFTEFNTIHCRDRTGTVQRVHRPGSGSLHVSACTLAIILAALFLWPVSNALSSDHAVILQYHHFGSLTPPSTSVTREQFMAHLRYLQDNDFVVWPLADIVANLQAGQPVPDRCVALTMDDAYVSVLTEAFDVMQELDWHFTVFVNPGPVDRGGKGHLTWDQMRRMAAAGVTFGNHSYDHQYLIRRLADETGQQWRQRVISDITQAGRRITEEVGQVPTLFAYPFGEFDPELKQIVVDLGLIGFGQQSGPIWAGSDFAALPRFPMAADFARIEQFSVKVQSLPLPVVQSDPASPILTEQQQRPVLQLKLAPGSYDADRIVAYASGQGQARLHWVDRAAGILEVQANHPLPAGRSRYNITAPALGSDRYYWFSHLWIRE